METVNIGSNDYHRHDVRRTVFMWVLNSDGALRPDCEIAAATYKSKHI